MYGLKPIDVLKLASDSRSNLESWKLITLLFLVSCASRISASFSLKMLKSIMYQLEENICSISCHLYLAAFKAEILLAVTLVLSQLVKFYGLSS